MPKYDWTNIKGETEPSSYQTGEHKVVFDQWFFDESKKGKVFLQMNFEKVGIDKKSDKPFCSCRLYFSSETAVKISRHHLHLICNKMGLNYTEDRVANDEQILAIGRELSGKEITIILEPTGGKSDKGFDYLGVNIPDVGALYIKSKNDGFVDEAMDALAGSDPIDDSDIPF